MLIPTLREKRHYLAIEVLSKQKLISSDVRKALESSVKAFLGTQEGAKAGLRIIELTPPKNNQKHDLYVLHGIVTVNRKYDSKAKASLVLLKEVAGKEASCTVKGISGTIKRLREKFLQR